MEDTEWVTWQEGASALGLKKSAFFYLVETGQIRKQPGTSPKQGRYSRTDILAQKKIREQRRPYAKKAAYWKKREGTMNVARKDLCQTLHELSGWDDTDHHWSKDIDGRDTVITTGASGTIIPAYDLGYLLRKLPAGTRISKEHDASPEHPNETPAHYRACYDTSEHLHFWLGASTPEDAACLLAIELLKSGIMK